MGCASSFEMSACVYIVTHLFSQSRASGDGARVAGFVRG